MTVVVLGLDALDPDIVDPDVHPNLTLSHHRSIETIDSAAGEPATHELWPTIITGLPPADHGLLLGQGGVGWENPLLRHGSTVADYVIPDGLQNRIGAWILNNTEMDAFRTPATYYENNGLSTVFDGVESVPIGVPNYVLDPDDEDREHQLRQRLGEYMDFDPDAEHTHEAADRGEFYEKCLEMVMVRIARTRRALRGHRHELVFGYTSGLDLVGHIDYDGTGLQARAYEECNDFVGELRADLGPGDELLIVSDHGLQDGMHTHEAMVASTDGTLVETIDSVTDVRDAIEAELERTDHTPAPRERYEPGGDGGEAVRDQLEDLGYM
jgi:hypothetical protein